jgi:light-regulated signal transduction histidine kinase (bacteriophytochrome)
MTQLQQASPIDLTECDREPIHVPGRVQSYGVLIVLDDGLRIRHISENASALLGHDARRLIGASLGKIFSAPAVQDIQATLANQSIQANPSYVCTLRPNNADHAFHAIAHRYNGSQILELEPASSLGEISFNNLYTILRSATGRLKGASSVADLCQITAELIRQITGFDRVMIYQFDPDWNGLVVAEDKIEDWNSYLDLRFPASDIPSQARRLYLINRLRAIADVKSTPASLIPETDPRAASPIDLSYAFLRSVSPIHIEYLRNMGVGASMSISIVQDERLWGLIAAHHRHPRRLSYEVRAACEHIAEIAALQLAAKAYAQGADRRIALKGIQTRLLAQMAAGEHFANGLIADPAELLSLTAASGCALFLEGNLHLRGITPSESQVRELIEWLQTAHPDQNVFHTDALPCIYPAAEGFKESASGLLSISMSHARSNFILWFRPEVIQTVRWAGDPTKPVNALPSQSRQLHPRKSFEVWKESVVGKSLPWSPEEITAGAELRDAIVGIILRKAEELAAVNAELRRSNRELEAFSYSVSHDLRAPFRHIAGFSDLLQKRAAANLDDTSRRYIRTIIDSAKFAGTLVDGLLAFSQMGRTALKPRQIDMSELVRDVISDIGVELANRRIDWSIDPLPIVTADLMMMKLVIRNLLSNAIKYSRTREVATIEVHSREDQNEYVFWIRDNGVGFDMRFKDKLFGVFQRLHRVEDFEGTGIGLANVYRMIERHGGRVWADGQVDAGATFFFTLPKIAKEID